jgi:hypothetical protein
MASDKSTTSSVALPDAGKGLEGGDDGTLTADVGVLHAARQGIDDHKRSSGDDDRGAMVSVIEPTAYVLVAGDDDM